MTKELIEDMREVVLPFVKKRLLEINYEGLGEVDAKEFEKEFNEILNLAIQALEQDPTTKNDLEVDCISRAEARKAIIGHQYSNNFCEEHNIDHSINTSMALIALSDLPSATPIRPKGHWIKGYTLPDGKYWKCDKCKELIKVKYPMYYCNNCGSDNREVVEE